VVDRPASPSLKAPILSSNSTGVNDYCGEISREICGLSYVKSFASCSGVKPVSVKVGDVESSRITLGIGDSLLFQVNGDFVRTDPVALLNLGAAVHTLTG